MVYIQTSLCTFQIRRIDIGNRAVAIPFEISDTRIFLQQLIHNAIYIILHLRITQIEYQLVTIVIGFTVRVMDCPVRMLFKQFTLRIHHFRFNPETELHTFFFSCLNQRIDSIRKFVGRYIPVAQSGCIAAAFVFVAKPSVIQQEHVYTEFFRFLYQVDKNILIKIESCIFPVIQQRQTSAFSILQLIIPCPVLKATASFTRTLITQCENKFRSSEHFTLLKLIYRSIRINGRNHTQITHIVHFESKAEVTCPSQCTHQDFPLIFCSRSIQTDHEKRLCMHGSTTSQLGIYHFLTELQLLCTHLHFLRPVSTEFCQIVSRTIEIQHCRSVTE